MFRLTESQQVTPGKPIMTTRMPSTVHYTAVVGVSAATALTQSLMAQIALDVSLMDQQGVSFRTWLRGSSRTACEDWCVICCVYWPVRIVHRRMELVWGHSAAVVRETRSRQASSPRGWLIGLCNRLPCRECGADTGPGPFS